RCSAISATTSCCSSGVRRLPARRSATIRFQSGIGQSRKTVERPEELAPFPPQRLQTTPAVGSQSVAATAPPAGGLLPGRLQPPAGLHGIEHRVERRHVEGDHALGFFSDSLGDLVAVQRRVSEDREDGQLGASPFDLERHTLVRSHIYDTYI